METLVIEKNVSIPPFTRKGTKVEGSCSHCWRIPRAGLKTCDVHLAKVAAINQKRKAQGLCTWGSSCPNRPAKPHVICRIHRKAMLIRNRAMRDERKAKKLCIYCNKQPAWWTVYCIICRTTQHKSTDPLPQGARQALADYRRQEKMDARREQAQLAVEWTTDERTRKIFAMRHGLDDGIDRTLEEIGAVFNVTRERIRQIENAQLKWLEGEWFDVSSLRPPFEEIERKSPEARRHLVTDEQRKKAACHELVKKALMSGELIKGLCAVCQSVDAVGHHHDYDKPLEVEWLCRKHHMEAHRGFWLDSVKPQTNTARQMLNTLIAQHVRPEQAEQETGISQQTIKKVLAGRLDIREYNIRAVQRLCDKLNANHAVN